MAIALSDGENATLRTVFVGIELGSAYFVPKPLLQG